MLRYRCVRRSKVSFASCLNHVLLHRFRRSIQCGGEDCCLCPVRYMSKQGMKNVARLSTRKKPAMSVTVVSRGPDAIAVST